MVDTNWEDYITQGYGHADILKESPEYAYYSYGSEWGSPAQTQYYQNQFQNIYNQYLGTLGKELRLGATGTEGSKSLADIGSMQFSDYLGNYDWTDRYTALPPSQRGEYTSQYNPRTRQIYF